MNYSFHPAAEAEFLESVGYYESKVPGLGGAFIEEFEALANLVGESPKAWQVELQPDNEPKIALRIFVASDLHVERFGNFLIPSRHRLRLGSILVIANRVGCTMQREEILILGPLQLTQAILPFE